ncbi:MAG: hypothetical protein LBU66_04675, partial [Treponema sp.]|nr:hypothetical protein [Treponema sp.]
MDLRQIEYSVEPEETNSILNNTYSPIIIKFDTEMKKRETENLLQVISDMGVMRGDLSWKGNALYFTPIQGWTAGIRYTASLLGTARSIDGRELRIEHFVSFYAINKNKQPLLEWHNPKDGESIGTADPVFEFRFSRPMNRLSVESALSIEGISNKTFEWSDDEKTIKLIHDKSLSPWSSYRWNLKDSAKSADGVPLPKSYSGYFTTDLDKIIPQVVNVYPILFSDGGWYPTGAPIKTGLAAGQSIAVSFNKPMGENVLRSVRFEPSLTGRTEMLSENSIVYIFTRDPEPETIYTLIVSADTRDTEGLKIGSEYRVSFTADIPYLGILSFLSDDSPLAENIQSNIVLPVKINPGTGEINFSIRFSLLLNESEKQNATQKINITPFFPRTLSPVALQFVHWTSGDRLHMRWEGLKAGDENTPHYYKLTIPGGKGG